MRRQALSSGCLPVFLAPRFCFGSPHTLYAQVDAVGFNHRQSCAKTQRRTYSVLLVPNLSKPSFLLFFLLAVAGSFYSVCGRLGNLGRDLRYEARVDAASLMDDVSEVRAQVDRAPDEFNAFWGDAARAFRTIKADLTQDYLVAVGRPIMAAAAF